MPLHSFLGIFLVMLSLFHGCSREEKEEHAGSDDSLPPQSFRIVSVEPEDYVDRIQPRLLLVTPQDNASGIATDSSIQLTFS